MKLAQIFVMMVTSNLLFWFGSNLQFLIKNNENAFLTCVLMGSLASVISFFTSKEGYGEFSMWELRMMAFSASYITFPFLAWKFFGESISNPKTMTSISLSVVLVCVQIFWK